MSSRATHEPMPRYCHTSALVGDKVLLYSGRTQDYSQVTKQRLESIVEVFDPYREVWETKPTTGEPPFLGVRSANCASIGDDLFMYGGLNGDLKWVRSLYRLDTKTYHWHKRTPQGESPMAKFNAGMVAYDGNLALIGGYGLPNGPFQRGSSFIKNAMYPDGRGWTNEFHVYNPKEDVWSSPATTGERPPPCSSFSFTSIDHRRAVMFGGGSEEKGRMNDVYIIDLQSMHWTKLSKSGEEPWPEERGYHAACCLNHGQQHPQLLITGGLNKRDKVLEDAWILDVDGGRWRKVRDTPQPRWAHSTTAISMSPGLTEVTMFGGSTESVVGSDEIQPKVADTTILQFRLREDHWELSDVVMPAELGQSEDRLREKVKALKVSALEDGANAKNITSVLGDSTSYAIDLDDIEFGDLLGQGAFGAVFQGKWKSKSLNVALKKVNCTPDGSDAKVMRELGEHPNIISFYGFAYNYPETIIVTALAKKGSLFDLLHVRKEKPTQQQSLTWSKHIAYGMAFMHRLDYVHRDLKSSNILFSDDMVAQVADFGTARFLKATTLASKTAGTLRWMAPEVARDDAINKQCDVFSFALVVWELMEHNIPFPEAHTDVMASVQILSGERPPISGNWPDYLSSLTQACWSDSPNDRPTFSDIVTSLENEIYFKR